MATRYHQWHGTTSEDTAAVCGWLASQSEKDEVTPVEGGHEVERVTVMQDDVVKDMM